MSILLNVGVGLAAFLTLLGCCLVWAGVLDGTKEGEQCFVVGALLMVTAGSLFSLGLWAIV
jgi:hypothetical protein